MKPLKLGLVGCGRVMEQGHVPALLRVNDAWTVAAVVDPTEVRRDLLGAQFSVAQTARFESLGDLLDANLVDAIDIAVPHVYHATTCLTAARAHMPFLSEKPLATSLEDADRILAAVAKHSVPAGIMHNYLHTPKMATALSVDRAGNIGAPFMFRMESMGSHWYTGADGYDPDWRSRRDVSGGGALLDNGYHNLYSAEHVIGAPVTQIFARVATNVKQQDVDDTATVILGHQNGATSIVLAAWSAASALNVTEIHGDRGSIRLEGDSPVLHTGGTSESLEVSSSADHGGFGAIFSQFAESVRRGARPLHTLAEGRRNLSLVMTAYESSVVGRALDIDTETSRSTRP